MTEEHRLVMTRGVPEEAMMCSRCHLVLGVVTERGGSKAIGHQHPPWAGPAPHGPAPVPLTTEAWRDQCDGCGDVSAGGSRFDVVPPVDEKLDKTATELCPVCAAGFQANVRNFVRHRAMARLPLELRFDPQVRKALLDYWHLVKQRSTNFADLPAQPFDGVTS